MIDAKTARVLSKENLYRDEIEKINEAISEAVSNGETICAYYDVVSSLVKDTLEDLGYIISVDRTFWTDSGYTTYIKW